MVNSQRRSAKLAITSLLSNKREWHNCFIIKFIKLKVWKYEIRAQKNQKIRAKSKKLDEHVHAMVCVRACAKSDAGLSQKHILPFAYF